MTDETTTTTMTTMRRRRTETTQSSVKLLKEDDGNGNSTNDVKYENNNDYNGNSNSNFFDDWGQGNWCWERDYNKYPVSFPSHNNRNCHNANDGINSSRSSSKRTIKEESCDDEQCGDDDVQLGDDNDNDIDIDIDIDDDEKKPAAIKSSAFDSDRVTTTASSEMDMTTTKREETRKISIRRRNSQIKVENKNAENHTNDDINSSVNSSNNENNDDYDEDDSSFYDDWVEGNWCLLDNYKNSNKNKNSNDDSDTSRGTTCSQNNNSNSKSSKRKRKRKRSRDDDDKEDEDIYNEEEDYDEENKDGNDSDDDADDEFLPEDNNDVRNHQKGKRPTIKDSKRAAYNGKHQNQIWMDMFQKLVTYKKLHKNTIVPKQYSKDPKLGTWVHTQRRNCKNDDILPNRLALLNSIYFRWEGGKEARDQMAWMNMYQKIVAYKKLHKNTVVPIRYEENPKLGGWVSKQRHNYKNQELLPKRVDLLKSIGFEWDGAKVNNNKLWMGMFQKLVAYKNMHKNSMVPSCYQEDPKLGQWVCRQRREYKNDSLLPKRIDLLRSIDFE